MTVTDVRPPRVDTELGDLAVRICSVLLGDGTKTSAVRIITALSLSAVPNATGAGVTLVGARGEPTSVAATSEMVLEADALQHHLNEGPCIDSWRNAIAVEATDLHRDGRWPAWARAVRPLNIDSVMSVPLVSAGHVHGSIKIYCDVPRAFDERTTAIFHQLAQTVTRLLEPAGPLGD